MGLTRNIPSQEKKELNASFNVPGLGQIIRLEKPNRFGDDGSPLRAEYYIREEGQTRFSSMNNKCGSVTRAGEAIELEYKGASITISERNGAQPEVKINNREPISAQRIEGRDNLAQLNQELSRPGIMPARAGVGLRDEETVAGPGASPRVQQKDPFTFCMK